MLGNKQVIISLITASMIVFFIATMSERPHYILSVTDFLSATPASDAEYRVHGAARLSIEKQTFMLCDEYDACIRVTLIDDTIPLPEPNKKLIIFGTWRTDFLEAHELITPCHEDIR